MKCARMRIGLDVDVGGSPRCLLPKLQELSEDARHVFTSLSEAKREEKKTKEARPLFCRDRHPRHHG